MEKVPSYAPSINPDQEVPARLFVLATVCPDRSNHYFIFVTPSDIPIVTPSDKSLHHQSSSHSDSSTAPPQIIDKLAIKLIKYESILV